MLFYVKRYLSLEHSPIRTSIQHHTDSASNYLWNCWVNVAGVVDPPGAVRVWTD